MSLLYRVIARQYLFNVAVLLLLLFALIVGIDFSLQFDEYTRAAGEIAKADESQRLAALNVPAEEIARQTRDMKSFGMRLEVARLAILVAFDLWWPRLFVLYNYLLGLVLVGAMGFTISQMVRHRELVAIVAGGISLTRLAIPIFAVAVGLTVLQGVNREVVVPQLAEMLTRDKRDAGKSKLDAMPLNLAPDTRGRLFFSDRFDPSTGTIFKPLILERDENGTLTRKITAAAAVWDRDAIEPGRGAWRLTDGVGERRLPDRVVTEPVMVLESDLDPTTIKLRRYDSYRQNLSFARLTDLMNRYRSEGAGPEKLEPLDRIRFSRFGVMFSNLLALAICLPFYLTREPANMLVRTIYAAPLALTALLGATLGSAAAIPGLPPAIAAFVPTLALLPLAIAAATSIKT